MDRNFLNTINQIESGVAPRRGAWIEITICTSLLSLNNFAPRRGAWIEIQVVPGQRTAGSGRTPQGCVDRNLLGNTFRIVFNVAPRRGAWIEIIAPVIVPPARGKVAPRRGAWIEISCLLFT